MHKILATGLGIGYIKKGGGTVAAIVASVVWYAALAGSTNIWLPFLITIGITVLGIWNSNNVEADWGKDSSKVVIDEIAGMCISLCFVPVTISYVIAALVLFRFFDILKPLFIKKLEALPGGWGVMLDDVVAGIYTNLIIQLFIVSASLINK